MVMRPELRLRRLHRFVMPKTTGAGNASRTSSDQREDTEQGVHTTGCLQI